MYQEILYEIVIFDHILGGGLAYEHLWQETFVAGAVFRSSALCLFRLLSFSYICILVILSPILTIYMMPNTRS